MNLKIIIGINVNFCYFETDAAGIFYSYSQTKVLGVI